MHNNSFIDYYKQQKSYGGQLHLAGIPFVRGVEYDLRGNVASTLTEVSGQKFYLKRCTPKEQSAEVLLSQIYAQVGLKSAIYYPVTDCCVVSNDVGKNGETARLFFARKLKEELEVTNPERAKTILQDVRALNAQNLGLVDFEIYKKSMTDGCARDYVIMRALDVGCKNSDRNLDNFIVSSNQNGVAEDLSVFDFGYSARVQGRQCGEMLEESYPCLMGGCVSAPREFVINELKTNEQALKLITPQQLAEKIGGVDVEATVQDIYNHIGFRVDQQFADNVAFSLCQTAEDLAAN